MLTLDRTAIRAPTCLATYDYRVHTWEEFGGHCKRELRQTLVQLQSDPGLRAEVAHEQGVRCAYCESAIYHEGHIEHFRRKNRALGYPQLTFEWNNLFLACGANDHCGHFKDRKFAPPYNPDHLIKPDEHDVDDYLYFHSTGEVRVKTRLKGQALVMAKETVRVFGLDDRALAGARANALKSYRKFKDQDLEELASWEEEERNDYLRGEIEATRWDPYASTIRHFLQTS
ncbi:retron system putative HNH endonuclease [Pseudomonas huaxiensis]|uniref:retron system putative HNH endonuclease n=1 Tax=Pseudomonas huaxiensis TaxID=2213017 RepID=UPI000DA671E4|nr:retron system putative HNH endonuclease [Pseudomonas huaxiensis]